MIGSDTRCRAPSWDARAPNQKHLEYSSRKPEFTHMFFADLVVIARGPEPDPIPNSTVKPLCANGTKSQGLGE